MKISQSGLDLIKEFEGLRLTAYLCSAGVLTIGFGHTLGVKAGQKITAKEADQLLEYDVQKCERAIAKSVTVPLTQGQFDVLCSFIFNLGVAAFNGSTLLKRLNEGDYRAVAGELLRWNKARGRVIEGLVTRRQREKNLWLQSCDNSSRTTTAG